MIVRMLITGDRTTRYTSRGSVTCYMCEQLIRTGEWYTRHQVEIPQGARPAKLLNYCLCTRHAPIREESFIEKAQASGEMPKIDVTSLPTLVVPVVKPTRNKIAGFKTLLRRF